MITRLASRKNFKFTYITCGVVSILKYKYKTLVLYALHNRYKSQHPKPWIDDHGPKKCLKRYIFVPWVHISHQLNYPPQNAQTPGQHRIELPYLNCRVMWGKSLGWTIQNLVVMLYGTTDTTEAKIIFIHQK